MSEPTDEQRRARALLRLMEDVPEKSNRTLRITTYWMIGLGALAALAATWRIIQSFEERGVAVAIAVVGGTLGVFALALAARLLGDAVIRASKSVREHTESGPPPQ